MPVQLIDNVVCNELPGLFLLFYGCIFYSVENFLNEYKQ